MNDKNAYKRRKNNKMCRLYDEMTHFTHTQLIASLADADPMKRHTAVMILHKRNSKAAVKDATRLCRSASPMLREGAAAILGQLNFPSDIVGRKTGEKIVFLLYELATCDPRFNVRANALSSLGHRASRGADHALILKAVDKGSLDSSATVRMHAAFALGGLNLPGADVVLMRFLQDKNKDVRDWGAFAVTLREFDECNIYDTAEIRNLLLELAHDHDENIQFEALRALGVLREKRAVPVLISALDNGEEIYWDLLSAAERIQDPALIPVLEKISELYDDDDGHIENALKKIRLLGCG